MDMYPPEADSTYLALYISGSSMPGLALAPCQQHTRIIIIIVIITVTITILTVAAVVIIANIIITIRSSITPSSSSP